MISQKILLVMLLKALVKIKVKDKVDLHNKVKNS